MVSFVVMGSVELLRSVKLKMTPRKRCASRPRPIGAAEVLSGFGHGRRLTSPRWTQRRQSLLSRTQSLVSMVSVVVE